jgi:hypothetical protein
MSVRLVSVVLVLLAVSVFSQQSTVIQHTQDRVWSRGQPMRPDTPPELDPRAAILEAIHHDAADLSVLSASLQSDLEHLQKGMLAKDLGQKLKKMEKLSKKLRQEVEP